MTVVRFDDISRPGPPRPLANLVNFALHPEFLDGNDLISADYLGPLERMADRETGALTIFTQGAVGTAEPERSTYHTIHERLEFTPPRLRAGRVRRPADGGRDRRRAGADVAGTARGRRFVRFSATPRSAMLDRWYPGPVLASLSRRLQLPHRPIPASVPIAGLPDCERPGRPALASSLGMPSPGRRVDPGIDTLPGGGDPGARELRRAPSYTGAPGGHRTSTSRRSGSATSCSRSAPASSGRTRARTSAPAPTGSLGNEYLGYDWGPVHRDGDGPTTARGRLDARTRGTRAELPPVTTTSSGGCAPR